MLRFLQQHIQPTTTCAVQWGHSPQLWCTATPQDAKRMCSMGLWSRKDTKTHPLPWPSHAQLNIVVPDTQMLSGTLKASSRKHLHYLPQQAKLAASEQWQTAPNAICLDYHMHTPMRITWYALRQSVFTRIRHALGPSAKLQCIEPAYHAMGRALRQMVPPRYPYAIMVISPHAHQWWVRVVHIHPYQCISHGVCNLQQITQHMHEHPNLYQPMWVDHCALTGAAHETTASHKVIEEALAPLHHQAWLTLPPLTTLCCQDIPDAWQKQPANHCLAVYGAVLRTQHFGHA